MYIAAYVTLYRQAFSHNAGFLSLAMLLHLKCFCLLPILNLHCVFHVQGKFYINRKAIIILTKGS